MKTIGSLTVYKNLESKPCPFLKFSINQKQTESSKAQILWPTPRRMNPLEAVGRWILVVGLQINKNPIKVILAFGCS
jgi:hypothetical protein